MKQDSAGSRLQIWRRVRLFVLITFGLVGLVAFSSRLQREMVDFTVWRTAAARALSAEPLYRESDGHYQFKYFPAFALGMAPFGLLEERAGKWLWFITSVGLLAALVHWSVMALPEPRLTYWLLVGLTTLLMAKFYARELLLGQTNILLGALLVGALKGLQRERPAAAGALVGLAVFVKPYALILMPWLLANRRARAAGAAGAVVALGLLAPAARYGWWGNIELLASWWRTVTASTAPNLLNNDNVSIAAMWAKWLGPGILATALAGLTVLGTLALVIAVWRHRHRVATPEYLECALLMLLIPLISPQGWDYVLLLATPAVVCLVDRWAELTPIWASAVGIALALMGLTMFDVIGRELYAHFMSLAVVSGCALALAVCLLHLRRRRLA